MEIRDEHNGREVLARLRVEDGQKDDSSLVALLDNTGEPVWVHSRNIVALLPEDEPEPQSDTVSREEYEALSERLDRVEQKLEEAGKR